MAAPAHELAAGEWVPEGIGSVGQTIGFRRLPAWRRLQGLYTRSATVGADVGGQRIGDPVAETPEFALVALH